MKSGWFAVRVDKFGMNGMRNPPERECGYEWNGYPRAHAVAQSQRGAVEKPDADSEHIPLRKAARASSPSTMPFVGEVKC